MFSSLPDVNQLAEVEVSCSRTQKSLTEIPIIKYMCFSQSKFWIFHLDQLVILLIAYKNVIGSLNS